MSKPIHVLIEDTETGEQRTYVHDFPTFDWTMEDWSDEGCDTFLWSEGQKGCDCNRALCFGWAAGEPNRDRACGSERYYIRITAPDGTVLYDELDP